MSDQNDQLRAEMGMNPSAQKALPYYNTLNVLGIIVCVSVALSINDILFYCLFPAYIPTVLLMIFWIASKCKYQDLIAILVHFDTILSTLWFITVFPVFVLACVMSVNFDRFTYYYSDTVDARLLAVAVITGVISCISATFTVGGIWNSARDVVLRARFGERDLSYGVVRVPQPYEVPATCTDRNGMGAAKDHCDEPVLIL